MQGMHVSSLQIIHFLVLPHVHGSYLVQRCMEDMAEQSRGHVDRKEAPLEVSQRHLYAHRLFVEAEASRVP